MLAKQRWCAHLRRQHGHHRRDQVVVQVVVAQELGQVLPVVRADQAAVLDLQEALREVGAVAVAVLAALVPVRVQSIPTAPPTIS
jgi:hypothetical protein